jgi:hypothetical protein
MRRWLLCNRLLHMALIHTLAFWFNLELGQLPLQLARLAAYDHLHIGFK